MHTYIHTHTKLAQGCLVVLPDGLRSALLDHLDGLLVVLIHAEVLRPHHHINQ